MKVLLASTPAVGHLNPVLAVSRILMDAGHQVVVTTGSSMRAQVEAIGVEFHPLPTDADFGGATLDDGALAGTCFELDPERRRFEFERHFIDTIAAQFLGLRQILRSFPADLIVAETMFGGTLPFLLGATANRPTIAGLGISCLPIRRDDGAPAGSGLPPAAGPADTEKYRALAAQRDIDFFGPLRRRADAALAKLGARPLPGPYLDSIVALNDIYLQPTVRGFEYPRRELPRNVRFIGSLPVPKGLAMPSSIRAALTPPCGRIVLVTQGTAPHVDPSQLLIPTLVALQDKTDLTVLAATGARPATDIKVAIPTNAIVERMLPFDRLMDSVDVLITNGGYGTVTHALSCGVPVVVAGLTGDRSEVAARVSWAGVGINLRCDKPAPALIWQAVNAILRDPGYRRRARRLGSELASMRVETAVCDYLEGAALQRTVCRFG